MSQTIAFIYYLVAVVGPILTTINLLLILALTEGVLKVVVNQFVNEVNDW